MVTKQSKLTGRGFNTTKYDSFTIRQQGALTFWSTLYSLRSRYALNAVYTKITTFKPFTLYV